MVDSARNGLFTAITPPSRLSPLPGPLVSIPSLSMVRDVLRLVDGGVVFLAGCATLYFGSLVLGPAPPSSIAGDAVIVILAAITVTWTFGQLGLYAEGTITRAGIQVPRLAFGLAVSALLLGVVGYGIQAPSGLAPSWLALWFCGAFLTLSVVRSCASIALHDRLCRGALAQRTVVVGVGEPCDQLVRYLRDSHDEALRILGVFNESEQSFPEAIDDRKPLDQFEDLIRFVRDEQIEHIVVALPPPAEGRMPEVLNKLRSLPVTISLYREKSAFQLPYLGVIQLGSVRLVTVVEPPLANWRGMAKACEDKVLAGLALLLVAPLLCFVALLIKLDSPGPILFRQARFGFNNHHIDVFKFRTMHAAMADPSGACQTRQNDPRVTRVGAFLRRTSLDELPQLLNVLKGDMSLVGPRPHPVGMWVEDRSGEELAEQHARRHCMKPGITGWAQINGLRGSLSSLAKLERRVEYDLSYIENWSVALDLKIILITALTVLFHDEAY